MIGLEAWFASGHRVSVVLPQQQPFQLFCREAGAGPWITLLHGFPTCSWDWAAVADALTPEHRLLLPDLLGFGDSDKPAGHSYSLVEQADAIEALWRHFDVRETRLVAHDIGGSVAQELLARQSDGRLGTRLVQVAFLNSALYRGVSRPRPVQKLLANGLIGPVLARLVTERLFTRNLAAVFSPAHPLLPETARDYWAAYRRHGHPAHLHQLLQYIPERQRHGARWEAALERTSVPLHFVWGMRDPVSGAAMADHIRSRLPATDLVELDDAGHYPQIEVPERVQPLLAAILRRPF
jgi:pimeloyl-ACP methyl ester carboxylesterase